MRKIVITGFALAISPQITGIQRFCREMLLRLDRLLEQEELEIQYIYPIGAANAIIAPEEFHHIKPVAVKMPVLAKNKYYKKIWLNRILNRYAKKTDAVGCCLAHEWPFGKPNVSFIHDIRPVVADYDTKFFRLKSKIYYQKCKKHCTLAMTGSDTQAKVICDYFGWDSSKVITIYPGWEQMKGVEADEKIFEKYSWLKRGEFYYSLGSLAPHKNFKWVMEVAKRNRDKEFVIAGGKDLKVWKDNIQDDSYSNVHFIGRVTDRENKALMQNCRAFLFPSKFEGFGSPPLEALACGAQVACAKATCLPEVYEDCVHYFDPDDYEVDLDKLMSEAVAPAEKVLKKCSYDRAASQLLEILKNEASK